MPVVTKIDWTSRMPAAYSFTLAVWGLSKFPAADRFKFFCLTYILSRKWHVTEAHWEQVGAVAMRDLALIANGSGATGSKHSRQTSGNEGDSE
ncbi:MAG: hypothetical protein ACRD5K_15790 [Candidatus Acidiferrales bacterium]